MPAVSDAHLKCTSTHHLDGLDQLISIDRALRLPRRARQDDLRLAPDGPRPLRDHQATEILESIVHEGYKGWIDSISVRMVRSWLDDLVALGEYDRDLVLAYARQTKYESSIERLEKIIDKFESSRGIAPVGSRRWEL